MKISLNVIPECPIEQIVQVVKHAENLGYQRCWVYDEGLATRDVHIVMTAIALETNLIEIGPGITNPYTRHPAQTAASIITLDELTKGRAFSWNRCRRFAYFRPSRNQKREAFNCCKRHN